ncbi:hypothetical protein [Pseudogemmobacter bohemicus]|uniref:hypothetical protein n=1 Tax=Pseudogemmobacter bohemicus TaxID=2250708 RepID=UPI000DD398C2|nr:hypothetical protein [Pseudogemmobacter bohemicus]
MTGAEMIDQIVTPIGGGIGAMLGLGMIARRQPDVALPRFAAPGVGVLVALALFAFKRWG